MKIKTTLFKLAIFLTLTFFAGYLVRSIHYKQDSQKRDGIQSELRTDVHEIRREFMPVVESAVKAIEDYEEIIEWNKASSAMAFEPKEEE